MYTVYPSYVKINPGEQTIIKITYFLRDLYEDLSKHKFKFEAIELKENSEKDLKEIFKHVDYDNKLKDKVFSISRTVKLIFGKNKNAFNNSTNFNNQNNNLFNTFSQNNFNLLYVNKNIIK
jgi:hypothetical protein